MYRLRLSLLFAVLASIIGTGWLADKMVNHWSKEAIDASIYLQTQGRTILQLIGNGSVSLQSLQQYADEAAQSTTDAKKTPAEGQRVIADILESINIVNLNDLQLPDVLRDQLSSGEELLLESEDRLQWFGRVGSTESVIALSIDQSPSEHTARDLVLTIVFYACVAGLILAWMYPLTRQLRRLGVVAESLGKGDLSLRIPIDSHSRLKDIENQFNRMAHRLQLLVEDNKLLAGAVSHDLRTPLARLRFGVDALREKIEHVDGDVAAEKQVDAQKYIARISDDLVLMENLVNALLEFARLDQSLQDMPKVRVRLSAVIQEQVDRSEGSPVTVQSMIDARFDCVLGDETYMRMLLGNLVENAQRFAASTVLIQLIGSDTLKDEKGELALVVEDDGPGFPPDAEEKLLKPFERGGTRSTGIAADANQTTGYGLGLAIVARLSQWFDARLVLERGKSLDGARVVVYFKRYQP